MSITADEGRRYKILIVEDDPAIAEAVCGHVASWGYVGEAVEDLRDVMGRFLEWKPQLVLLDISLPFYDGFYWCRKIRAVMRRAYDFGDQLHWLEHKGAVLNTEDMSLSYQGKRIDLTKNDHRILQTLMENKGRVVSRDVLMTRLWETDSYIDENTLTVNVARLRRKLSSLGISDLIRTKKGMGYIIE